MATLRYAYKNTKTNIAMRTYEGGTWVRVGFFTYWWLRLTSGIVRAQTDTGVDNVINS